MVSWENLSYTGLLFKICINTQEKSVLQENKRNEKVYKIVKKITNEIFHFVISSSVLFFFLFFAVLSLSKINCLRDTDGPLVIYKWEFSNFKAPIT